MMEEPTMDQYIWRAVLDDQTCEVCRALHNKPIGGLGITPPLHHGRSHGCTRRGGCRCYILNVTNLKSELVHAISVEESFIALSKILRHMVQYGMISRKDAIRYLSKWSGEDTYTVRFEIIEFVDNFVYEVK